jgi:hypothetical protein
MVRDCVAARAGNRRNGRTAREAPQVPDVLGERGRARMVAALLLDWQKREQEVDQVQAANGHEDGDPVPGLPPREDGTAWTYAGRRLHFRHQQEGVVTRFADIMPIVRERLPDLQAQFEQVGLL